MKRRLSVIIIVRDAAAYFAACLESARFADEIVIVDSGSVDDTLEIAHRYTDNIYSHPDWPGFGVQKNRALGYATGDWVLALDADERVTPTLQSEIAAALAHPTADVYAIPRLSSYCGRVLRHSGWWPDYTPRLFQRQAAYFSDDLVHERLRFTGTAARLSSPLLHESFRTLDEVLDKLNRYSSAGAAQMAAQGRQGSVRAAVGHALWTFLRTYVFRLGFLDGREGLLLAVSNAEGVYYRYLKLMYLNERCSLH